MRTPSKLQFVALLLPLLVACAKDDVDQARKKMQESGGQAATGQQLPPGHPTTPPSEAPMGGMSDPASVPNDGNAVPLKSNGSGSAAELQRDIAKLGDAAVAASFERAYRMTFSSDRAKRDYHAANDLLAAIEKSHPKFAPAYRTRGYAIFNMNPAETGEAMAQYEKAVEIDPNYGEAHYAIAFMCAATDELDKGVEHYKKAMALGVPDERNIGQRFYADRLSQ